MLLMFTGNLEGTSLTSKMLWKRPGPPAALVVLAGISYYCIFTPASGLVMGGVSNRQSDSTCAVTYAYYTPFFPNPADPPARQVEAEARG